MKNVWFHVELDELLEVEDNSLDGSLQVLVVIVVVVTGILSLFVTMLVHGGLSRG